MRNSSVPASDWLGIKDEARALAFNLAASHRLMIFDMESQKHLAKLIAYEVSKMFAPSSEPDDLSGATVW